MNDTFLEKMNKKFDNNDEKINCICTLLGCSANLVEFIHKNYDMKDLPPKIKYIFGLVASHVIGLTQDNKPKIIDVSKETEQYFMQEQTQEIIYRTMKKIITEIYNSFEENENA